jgi:hypothetical protein
LAKKPTNGGRPPKDNILNKNMYLDERGSDHKNISFIFFNGDPHTKKIILADSKQ